MMSNKVAHSLLILMTDNADTQINESFIIP